LGFFRERHASQQEDKNHQHLEHNPLKPHNDQLDHLNPYAVYDDLEELSKNIIYLVNYLLELNFSMILVCSSVNGRLLLFIPTTVIFK
jgi:hypothetical protein